MRINDHLSFDGERENHESHHGQAISPKSEEKMTRQTAKSLTRMTTLGARGGGGGRERRRRRYRGDVIRGGYGGAVDVAVVVAVAVAALAWIGGATDGRGSGSVDDE